MTFGTLAGSHLNLTLRLFQAGGTSLVTGMPFQTSTAKLNPDGYDHLLLPEGWGAWAGGIVLYEAPREAV